MRFAIAALVVVWLSAPSQTPAVVRSRTTVVQAFVTVTIPNAGGLRGLQRDDFEVYDDGQRASIVAFSNEHHLLSVLAMFQAGFQGEMSQNAVRRVARALIGALGDKDEASIGTFGAEVSISPVWSRDVAILQRVVDEELWTRFGRADLAEALELGLRSLSERTALNRRVLLVAATENAPAPEPAATIAMSTNCDSDRLTVFGLALSGRARDNPVADLVERSGGALVVLDRTSPERQLIGVLDELRSQYELGFEPASSKPGVHKIEIRVHEPLATVKTRSTYVNGIER